MTCLIWEDRSSVYYLTGSICYVVYSLLLEFQVSSSNVWMTEVALLASGLFTINCKIRFLKCMLILICSRKTLMFDASKLDSDFLGKPLRFSIIWPSSTFFSSHIHHQLSPILLSALWLCPTVHLPDPHSQCHTHFHTHWFWPYPFLFFSKS